MANTIKAQYTAQEIKGNVNVHGYFARPQFRGTIDWRTLCSECLADTTYNPREVAGGMEVICQKLMNYFTKGFRVEIADLLTLYPNLTLTVKDTTDPSTGQTTVVEPKDLSARNAVSRIGCTISNSYKETAVGIKWERINKQGQVVSDDDATQGNENVEQNQPSTLDPSTNNTPGENAEP